MIYLTKLPYLLMLIYLLCCIGYASQGDWRRAAYWFGALVITVSITA